MLQVTEISIRIADRVQLLTTKLIDPLIPAQIYLGKKSKLTPIVIIRGAINLIAER